MKTDSFNFTGDNGYTYLVETRGEVIEDNYDSDSFTTKLIEYKVIDEEDEVVLHYLNEKYVKDELDKDFLEQIEDEIYYRGFEF